MCRYISAYVHVGLLCPWLDILALRESCVHSLVLVRSGQRPLLWLHVRARASLGHVNATQSAAASSRFGPDTSKRSVLRRKNVQRHVSHKKNYAILRRCSGLICRSKFQVEFRRFLLGIGVLLYILKGADPRAHYTMRSASGNLRLEYGHEG